MLISSLLQIPAIRYLPIITTVVAIVFLGVLIARYRTKGGGVHLLWWAAGVLTYGTGTFLESIISLTGNSIWLNKLWYVSGALLGAYPLAQGTVYLLLQRRTANRLSAVTIPVVVVLAVLVLLSPVNESLFDPQQPSGRILQWKWLRSLTPLINVYAAGFLVGGAVASSRKFFRAHEMRHRAVGNALIAVGALLPGIGGIAAKMGGVELLYVTELIGLLLIWMGYSYCVRPTPVK